MLWELLVAFGAPHTNPHPSCCLHPPSEIQNWMHKGIGESWAFWASLDNALWLQDIENIIEGNFTSSQYVNVGMKSNHIQPINSRVSPFQRLGVLLHMLGLELLCLLIFQFFLTFFGQTCLLLVAMSSWLLETKKSWNDSVVERILVPGPGDTCLSVYEDF